MHFTDISVESGLDAQGFGWGGVFEDVNLDGRLDLWLANWYVQYGDSLVGYANELVAALEPRLEPALATSLRTALENLHAIA